MSNHFRSFHLQEKNPTKLENLYDTMTDQNTLFNSVKILDYC